MRRRQLEEGWTTFESNISGKYKQIFDEAVSGLVGVGFEPVAVSKQIVSGINYRFFCNSVAITPNDTEGPVIVGAYQPLEGHIKLTEIRKIDF